MNAEHVVETDVLVIGGGLAGCFAGIKAREQGAKVILVDKGRIGKTGGTPYAGDTMVFNEDWGHDLEAWLDQYSALGEYMNNREWNEIVCRDSYERFLDLKSYGVKFEEKDGEVVRFAHPNNHVDLPDKDKFPPLVSEVVHWLPGWMKAMRKKVKKSRIKLMERTIICDLIKQDGVIVGAVGLPVDGDTPIIIKAKSVVVAAGGGGFRPPGYPTHGLTADGMALGYNVGAKITGCEWVCSMTPNSMEVSPLPDSEDAPKFESLYEHFSSGATAAAPGATKFIPFLNPYFNAEGDEVPHRGVSWHGWIDAHYEIHQGRGPIHAVMGNGAQVPIAGTGSAGSSHGHATNGLVPVDTDCSVGVPGLYAAGDSLGSHFVGATYSGFGCATSHASATGARAGNAAAIFALDSNDVELDEQQVDGLVTKMLTPLVRKGGFSPRWVTETLRSYITPYYVMYIKHGKRLQNALDSVEFIRDHIVPKMVANDPHELRIVHETKNMVFNAELKLRSSLMRTESRGNHYREDYPDRDDSWLAHVVLEDVDGQMVASKKPIPDSWKPKQDKSYEEKYPMEFPTH
ncbi:FAD-binding protein [Vibrio sp. RC27]